jgi:hypothetical protein
MRSVSLVLLFFPCLFVGCKTEGKPVDSTPAVETDADTDADADTDTDTDTDSGTETECWVDSPTGECYECPPPTTPSDDSLEFLNACTDVDSVTFVNADRIPASTWQEGDALPPVN